MTVPIAIAHRPFSVEQISGLMLPDGIFDGALTYQSINCFVANTSQQDLNDVDVYLEGIGDPGIVPDFRTAIIPLPKAGESQLCSWPCDFSQSSPGKTMLSIRAHGGVGARPRPMRGGRASEK
jgi:hypothetical protein